MLHAVMGHRNNLNQIMKIQVSKKKIDKKK